MSNIYIQEPPTRGRVVLSTTVGDIEIDLWSRECPKACRNFVQLCMENYYNKTLFHRVVKDFIVQGGDPTGTGRGGESIYGHPFKDEIHSRLRFVRRGLVAMANAGKDDNGSQFFFTMGQTPELMNKHTIFGKVVGDTIYNMIKLQDGMVRDEKPEYPNKIIKAKVVDNPFPDIQPRQVIEMIKDDRNDKKPKSKMKATKDFKLLSFGEEAEEEEEDLVEVNAKFSGKGGKSSHDLLKDPKLLSEVGEELKRKWDEPDNEQEEEEEDGALPQDERTPKVLEIDPDVVKNKLKREKDKQLAKKLKLDDHHFELNDAELGSGDQVDEKSKRKSEIQNEIRALKKQMRSKDKDKTVQSDSATEPEDRVTEEERNNDMLRNYHEEQKKYAQKVKAPKKGSDREAMTMKLLEKFKSKLHNVKEDDEDQMPKNPEKSPDEDDDFEGDDWMKKELKFVAEDPVLAKDANTKDDDWFDIYDPRNPVNKRRRNEDSKKKYRRH